MSRPKFYFSLSPPPSLLELAKEISEQNKMSSDPNPRSRDIIPIHDQFRPPVLARILRSPSIERKSLIQMENVLAVGPNGEYALE